MSGLKPVRVACIGCGFIGRRHMENVAVMPGVQPYAFADVRPEAAEAFLREFGGNFATTEPAQVFEDPAVDAVIIATYHDSHTPLAVCAAAARKHILLEKPMALTVEECRRIQRAVSEAGVVCSINFKFRFAPAVLRTREVIPLPILTVGQLAMERTPTDFWVRDPVRGGGLIIATACHVLDMVCFLNRSEPVRVYAEAVPQGAGPHEVEAASATVRFASGAVASLGFADAGENPYTGKWLHQVFDGERSAVLYDHFCQVRFSGADLLHFAATDEIRADGTYGLLEDFVQSIRTGTEPSVGVRDGLRATLLASKITESLESGTAVEVKVNDGS